MSDSLGSPNSDASTVEYRYSWTPHSTPQQPTQIESEGSTSSYESEYEMDPEYSGTPPQSQPCDKHGVKYVPRGMRRVLVKKRKLEFDDNLNTQ